jgi:undecaprenyl-diphosphatase
MLEWLLKIDHTVFGFVNQSLANPVTDFIMPVITNDWFLRILFGLILVALLVFGGRRFIWVIAFSLVVVILTDQSCNAWLKPLFGRIRPCRLMSVHLLVSCGPALSFPSSHAANLFGQAVFFGLLFKKYLPYSLGFAFLVGVSRVFVGVHYPLDVAGGMLLGVIIGAAVAGIMWHLEKMGKLKPAPPLERTGAGAKRQPNIIER